MDTAFLVVSVFVGLLIPGRGARDIAPAGAQPVAEPA